MQVARITNDITVNYNKNNVTAMALLDTEKTFDTDGKMQLYKK